MPALAELTFFSLHGNRQQKPSVGFEIMSTCLCIQCESRVRALPTVYTVRMDDQLLPLSTTA